MDAEEFSALRKEACELYDSQPSRDKHKVSLDAIFIALSGVHEGGAKATPQGRKPRKPSGAPPEWFNETLNRLKGTGEKITISRFLLLAGKFPATKAQTLDVGQWLRDAGIEPEKVGGNLLFKM